MVQCAHLQLASCTRQLCFSAGVAEPADDDDRDALMRRVDKPVIAEKRAGRNRVYLG